MVKTEFFTSFGYLQTPANRVIGDWTDIFSCSTVYLGIVMTVQEGKVIFKVGNASGIFGFRSDF